jgi:hypothetical protein
MKIEIKKDREKLTIRNGEVFWRNRRNGRRIKMGRGVKQ